MNADRGPGSFGAGISIVLLRGADAGFSMLQPLAEELLAVDERAEFDRIRAQAARGGRIACRAWLRATLGQLLGLRPSEVPLVRSGSGRLELASGPRGFFNVSQSDGVIAVAIGDPWQSLYPLQIGIDVEVMARRWSPDLAAALFGEDELAWLLERPETERDAAFLSLWSLREALLKADGRGLSLDVGEVRFSPDGSGAWRIGGAAGEVRPRMSGRADRGGWRCWLRQDALAVCALAVHGLPADALLHVDVRTLDETQAMVELRQPALQAAVATAPATTPVAATMAAPQR
jgi:4'-phosphopantetheinyl transferase